MNTKSISFLFTALLTLFVLSSCQSKEERIINKLENLATRVQKGGEKLTDKEWGQILEEYDKLQQEALYCDFSQEQLKRIGRAEGRLTAIMTKEEAKKIGRDFVKFLEDGSTLVEGFVEGIVDGLSTEE